ncbi:MAG: D-alanyl-D-alanine carboxypeptidase/D-alanyl-D-alanine-endopeptidase [Bacteroidales bacterium]|nr:D-alanyl-D-alanine carboxypeptidase/D-alanyl-D-alanine-endopeptidase [Bacteroidales bacterium]
MKLFASLIVCITTLLFPINARSAVLDIAGEKHTSIGIYIYDLKADTVVFQNDADRNLVPASITKAITSASALRTLGKNFRFRTRVRLEGCFDGDSSFSGIIHVLSSGDPTLESAYFPARHGFADSIASNIKKAGIKHIKGFISVDERPFNDGPIAQWEIEDVAWAYGAGIYQFNYKDNIFKYNIAQKKCQPEVPGMDIVIRQDRNGLDLMRGVGSQTLCVATPNARKGSFTSTVPCPAEVFKNELAIRLSEESVRFEPQSSDFKFERNDIIDVYTQVSPSLPEILKSLMFRSDNMFAEGILRAMSAESSRNAAIAREKKLWKNYGLETEFVSLVDGSGLARSNRFSAKFIGSVLENMARSGDADLYSSFFPRVGKEGTVRSFLKDTEFSGRLALKTGSMNGVQCYAGYAFDDNNKPSHIVVIMINSFFCKRAELREAVREMLLDKLHLTTEDN